MTAFTAIRQPAAVLLSAGLLSVTFGVLASATEDVRLAAPSPTASAAPHVFYGVEPVPPPMPKDPAGKLGGSLAPAKAVGGPVAKVADR